MEDRDNCEDQLENNENANTIEDPEKTHYFWIQGTEAEGEQGKDRRKTLTELLTNQTLNKKEAGETSQEPDADRQNPQRTTTPKEESKDGEKLSTKITCSR